MPTFDSLALRRALGQYATGVAIATTRDAAGQPVGLTINSFASLSLDPPLVLWAIGLHSPSLSAFEQASHYAVNVLSREQLELSRRFASPVPDRFGGLALEIGRGGVPLLPACLARFECRISARLPGGDHLLLLGEVEHFERSPGEPLLYWGGAYRAVHPEAAE